jgi:hypothetical protein
VKYGGEQLVPVGKSDFTNLRHAVFKADITGRAKYHNAQKSCDLAERHSIQFSRVGPGKLLKKKAHLSGGLFHFNFC